MGFDEGRIILDNNNGIYVTGQTIFGRILFDQEKPKDIHGIYVSCKGFCNVHWTSTVTERVNDRDETRTINHESFEEYFKKNTFIIGNAGGEYRLEAGHYEYNFSCTIPENCPSSFEGAYGHIRYYLKVVMVTSGLLSMNKEKKVAIQLYTPLDLNTIPSCKEPLEFELAKSYCCWCMSSGSSEVRVKLPVGGYCPGQVIPMDVSVVNQSSVDISELNFSIRQKIKFIATTNPDTNYDNKTVAAIKKGPIPAHTTRNWQVNMEVPVMNAYNLYACRYIDIDYFFKVSTEVSGCHRGSEVTHPIIIGNVPFVSSHNLVHSPPQNQNLQASNYYPPPAIIQQPLPHSPYPNSNNPKEKQASQPSPTSTNGYRNSGSTHSLINLNSKPVPSYPKSETESPYSTGNPIPLYPPSYSEHNLPISGTITTSTPAVSNAPYPTSPATNPFASAPEPSTQGSDSGIPAVAISRSPAYNPEFVEDKETDKTQPK